MFKLLFCPKGHFWETAEENEGELLCPECGDPAESAANLESTSTPSSSTKDSAKAVPLEEEGQLVLPGYELLEELARGPTGIRRFRARQVPLQREVLLEVVLAREDPKQRAWSSLRSEAGMLARLRHPHIVTLYEAGERDRQLFYNVLEESKGSTLKEIHRAGKLTLEQIQDLMEKLAQAIEHAHQRRVLHRHLEPEKVVLVSTDEGSAPLKNGSYYPRVTGFGLARRPVEGDPTDAELFVEPGYLAPEQAWGRSREIGPQTDVYGLGGLLYFLLTGRAPFQGANLGELLDAIQIGPLVPPSRYRRVPADLEYVCLKALSRQARHRHASAAALAEDLQRVRRGVAPEGASTHVSARLKRWVARHPMGTLLILMGVLVLGWSGYCYRVGYQEGVRIGTGIRGSRGQEKDNLNIKNIQNKLLVAQRQLHLLRYKQNLDQALRAMEKKEPDRARVILDSCALSDRNFEWHYLMQMSQGKERALLPGNEGEQQAMAMAMSAGSPAVLALVSQREGGVQIQEWEVRTRKLVRTVSLKAKRVPSLAYSQDGQHLAAIAEQDRSEIILCHEQGVVRVTPAPLQRRAGTGAWTSLAWSPKGQQLILGGEPGRIYLVNPLSGQLEVMIGRAQHSQEKNPTSQVAFRADGLAVAWFMTGDSEVKQFHASNGAFHLQFVGPGTVRTMAYSPRGGLLAVARSDNSVRLHETRNGAEVARVENLPDPIRHLAFSPDGHRLAMACGNDTILIYALQEQVLQQLLSIPAKASLGLAFASERPILVAADVEQTTFLGVVEE